MQKKDPSASICSASRLHSSNATLIMKSCLPCQQCHIKDFASSNVGSETTEAGLRKDNVKISTHVVYVKQTGAAIRKSKTTTAGDCTNKVSEEGLSIEITNHTFSNLS